MGLWEGELFFPDELVVSDSLCFVGNNGFAVVWFLSGTMGNWKASKQTSSSSPRTMSCLESWHSTEAKLPKAGPLEVLSFTDQNLDLRSE